MRAPNIYRKEHRIPSKYSWIGDVFFEVAAAVLATIACAVIVFVSKS